MKKFKKIIAGFLSVCLVTSMISAPTFAKESAKSVNLDVDKTYAVPIQFYNDSGKKVPEEGNTSSSATDFIDDVAVIKNNGNGTYAVTLNVENYHTFDVLQIAKPGAFDDTVVPYKTTFGTYNIPTTFINKNEGAAAKYAEYFKTNADATLNDKFIPTESIKVVDGIAGTSYVTFNVDSLDKTMLIRWFRSYFSKSDASKCEKSGELGFKLAEKKVIPEISAEAYKNVGLDLVKVPRGIDGQGIDFPQVGKEAEANNCLTTATAVVENGAVKVTGSVAEDVTSVRVLTGMTKRTELTPDMKSSAFELYKWPYASEKHRSGDVYSIYSDNLLTGSNFAVEFANINEVAFGKQVEIKTAKDTYYGELRVRPEAKTTLELKSSDVTMVSDNYALPANSVFVAEKLEKTGDEDNNRYNNYYKDLACSSSDAIIYELSIKSGDTEFTSPRAVEYRFPIPADWDRSKISVKGERLGVLSTPINYLFDRKAKFTIEGNELILTGVPAMNSAIAITLNSTIANLASLKDGIYKAVPTMWMEDRIPNKYGMGGQLSMSNAVINPGTAYIKVENGKKFVSFETQPVKIGDALGYSNGIFVANNEFDGPLFNDKMEQNKPVLNTFNPLNYYGYHLDKNGSTDMDGYAKDYNLYYPKRVGFELPASADRDNGAFLQFYVPIMDELQGKVPGSGEGNRVAFMTLSDVEPILETMEAEYDKSTLVVALDKVSNYDPDDYTVESYKALADAKAKAEKVISGEVKATEAEIIALNKEIEEATKTLVEAPESERVISDVTLNKYFTKYNDNVYKYRANGKQIIAKPIVKNVRGTVLKEGVDYKVKYSKANRVLPGKYTITVNGIGKYKGTVEKTLIITPKAVTNVNVRLGAYNNNGGGYDDAYVTWNKAEGADGYYVYMRRPNVKDNAWKPAGRVEGTSLLKKNLYDGYKYEFKVLPYVKADLNYKTNENYKLANVQTLMKSKINTVKKYNNVRTRLTWTKVRGVTGYQVKVSAKGNTRYFTINSAAANAKVVKNAKTTFKVRAYKEVKNNSGKTIRVYAPWSDGRIFTLR